MKAIFLTLRDAEVMVAVADAGSISGGATLLALGQPQVSRQVAAIEHRAGCALLERNCHGIELTDKGRVALTWATRMLVDAEMCLQAVRG